MKLPWKYILLSLLIGLISGVAGGLVVARCYSRGMRWNPQHMIKRFDRELKLSPEQRSQIESILNASRQKMQVCRKDIRQTASAEIQKLLTPEQQSRFNAWEARREAQWKKREARDAK